MDLSTVTVIYKNFISESNSFLSRSEFSFLTPNSNLNTKNPLQLSPKNSDLTTSSTNDAHTETYEDYFDIKFPKWISLVLLIIGVLGNLLCLLIFCQKNLRKNSTFIYLAFLSMVDIFVLTLGLGDIVLISYPKIVIRNRSAILCRLHVFLTYLFTHLSSFILATVSIDRAIATNFLNFAKIYCKPKMAYKVTFLATMLSVFINFHSLFFMGYEQNKNETNTNININNLNSSLNNQANYLNLSYTSIYNENNEFSFLKQPDKSMFVCGTLNGTLYDRFLDPYFEWIDLFFYAILPFFTMAICTYLIIRVLIRSNKRLEKSEKKSNTNGKNFMAKLNLINGKPKKNVKKSTKAKHLTYTLITLNTLFFCLVSPLVIFYTISKGKQTEASKIVMNIVYLLAYSNHSFNFILYAISSPPYREALFRLFNVNQIKNKNRTPV